MHIQSHYHQGFTLIELMVTISIAAILLGVAIPSFTSTITSNRLTTNANELVTALNLARSEAIKRGQQVTVRRKGTTNTQWESGWDVFVDINNNGSFDDTSPSTPCETNVNGSPSEDCLLRTYASLPSDYTLRSSVNYACWVAYAPTGLSKGSGTACSGGGLENDTFRLCKGSDNATSRAIIINKVGRVKVSTGTTSCP
ncbi:MAG: GspH/FimT family pseudopilin [Methylococcaceae bacterium]|nr:GspH/FimT family pseudopilin [Methylococcaceae bacterium]MDP3904387.1 GspH/FimT family pseudopilin [Methylococcaceae bacterium]